WCNNLSDGATISLRNCDVAAFTTHVLPRLENSFVLVTGSSDESIPSSMPEIVETLQNSGKLLHWFTCQYDGDEDDALFTAMPIGPRYPRNTELQNNFTRMGATRIDYKPPRLQELEWARISRSAPSLSARLPRAVADFHLNNTSQHRLFGE